MPHVVAGAVVAGGIAAGAAALTAPLVTSAVLGSAFATAFFSTLVIGGISQALVDKPRFDTLRSAGLKGGQTVSVRSAADSAKIMYGETRVGGTIAFMETTSNDRMLHLIIVLAGHKCDSVGDIYIGDRLSDATPIEGNTYLDVPVDFAPYTRDGEARVQVTRGAGPSLNFASIFQDWETVFEVTGSTSNDGIYKRVIESNNSIGTDYVRCVRIDDGAGVVETGATVDITIKYVWVNKHEGWPDAIADADLNSASDDWGANDRLRGLCYIYVRAAWNSQIFPQGLENISAVVKGKEVYDPRTDTSTWSDNPALIVADYLTDGDFGYGAAYADIDETQLIAAANICEESVSLVTGTEDRYTCNGVLDTAADPPTNLGNLLSSMGGKAVFSSGKWRIFPAAYNTPAISLDEDDVIDTISVQTRVPRRDLFNAVKGLFIDPEQNYQPADFPAQVSTAYATEDGSTLFQNMELQFTNTNTMAQRLARIELLKVRQQIAVKLRCKLSAMRIQPCDVIYLTNSRLGWTHKVFECIEWSMTYETDQLMVELGLRETAPTIYDWNTGLELSYDVAPDTNLPNPWTLAAPTDLGATSGSGALFLQADGTVVSRILVSWSHPNPAVVAGYEIGWQNSTAGSQYSDAIALTPSFYISPVSDGDHYNIRVRAFNHVGIKSAYVDLASPHQVVGKIDAPPDVDTFTVLREPDGTREFSWTLNSPPADLAGYKIRYKNGTGGTWATMTELHSGLLSASPFETNLLAAGTYTVGIKAIDFSGNESENAKLIESTLGDPRMSNAILFVDFVALKFPGTQTDCAFDPVLQALIPGSDDSWSTIPGNDWPDWNKWNVDPVSSMVYQHSDIDLGAVVKFKVLASATIASGTVTTEEQHSDDNSTWSSWATTGPQISGRYLRVRITVTNPYLDGMTQASIIIDAESVRETLNDLSTSTISSPAGDFRLPITKSYSSIWIVNIALQNVGSGWTWEIIDKNTTSGPRIKIYNASGTLADATIDAEIKGV